MADTIGMQVISNMSPGRTDGEVVAGARHQGDVPALRDDRRRIRQPLVAAEPGPPDQIVERNGCCCWYSAENIRVPISVLMPSSAPALSRWDGAGRDSGARTFAVDDEGTLARKPRERWCNIVQDSGPTLWHSLRRFTARTCYQRKRRVGRRSPISQPGGPGRAAANEQSVPIKLPGAGGY